MSHAGGPYNGTVGAAIQFNGTGSYDPDGTIMQYHWDFGDGVTDTGATPTHAYAAAGVYTVALTVADNAGGADTSTTTATISNSPPPPPVTNDAVYASDNVPSTMIAGQSYSVSIGMRNTGTSTWTAAENYRLGSQNPQDNNTWGVGRVNVPSSIPPKAIATFNFAVVAPSVPGTYNFQWRMLRENVEWFGEYTQNFTITVNPPQPGGPPSPSTNALSAQLEPRNRTGQAGEDLLSGNYNWSLPLLGLTGRAGHDLSLALSYNSLVWTKYQSSIQYDVDQGFPAPGFRLGFPVVQPRFLHDATGSYAYMLITPGGAHIELRQIGTSNIYEAADSSYLQLIDYGSSLLLRDTAGTQWSFAPINGQYQCTEVKDRNGNFISIYYDGTGRLGSVVDTLNRTFNFNYDVNGLLQSITQTWNGQSHPWATFLYGSIYIQTNFAGLAVIGPHNTNQIVLTHVSLHDGSRYAFTYSSWGQVYQIEHFAADGHRLNYVSYNLPQTASVALDDSPRFTQRRDWAEDWNNGLEAVSTFNLDPNGSYGQMTLPDNTTVYKEFFGTSGWQRGLTTRTETWSAGTLQKWTTTDWTQDNTGVSYRTNARPAETNIYDASGNRRRTTIDYQTFTLPSGASCSLPSDVYEWNAAGSAVLRRTHTGYNLDANYLNRRIIGLPQATLLYDGGGTLMAKNTYGYDAGGEYLQGLPATPTRHDGSYNTSFVVGRGNLTDMARWDVTDPNNAAKAHRYGANSRKEYWRNATWCTASDSDLSAIGLGAGLRVRTRGRTRRSY